MSNTALNITPTTEDSQFVRFWNEVLASKFIRFKHILVGGLSRHSEAVFPTLPVRPGDLRPERAFRCGPLGCCPRAPKLLCGRSSEMRYRWPPPGNSRWSELMTTNSLEFRGFGRAREG
jgi:hypothetical protein